MKLNQTLFQVATPVLTGRSYNMLEAIHAEIAPQLQAMRQADSILDNCVKGRPATGREVCEAGSLDKYNHVFTIANARSVPGSLANENTPFAGLMTASMNKAGEDTRSNAGGMNAQG